MKLVYFILGCMVVWMVGAGIVLANKVIPNAGNNVKSSINYGYNVDVKEYQQLKSEVEELRVALRDRNNRLKESKQRINYWYHHSWKAERNLLPWQSK